MSIGRRFSCKKNAKVQKYPLVRRFSCKKNTKKQKVSIDSPFQLQKEFQGAHKNTRPPESQVENIKSFYTEYSRPHILELD